MSQISPTGFDSATPTPLQRNLGLIETCGFGLTGLLLWMGVAPGALAELGSQSIWVWIPGAIIGVLINLQVRQLGQVFPDVSGGTPNYVTHLLKDVPNLTTYAALGYFMSWVAVLPVNAIILTDLIEATLDPLGIALPKTLLRVGFTVLAFIVAFSGSRALGTLHLIFLLPAVGFLLAFCLQGSYAVATSASLSFLPQDGSTFSLEGWAKWYLNGTYAFYACETASVFVADSERPKGTLRVLLVAAAMIPIVYIGGSWVLLHLSAQSGLNGNTFLSLLNAAQPFWGNFASFLVTFLVVSSSLLSCATAVSICPRILYQLAQDGHLSPVFGITSRQGVFGPGLILTLILSLACLAWGDLHRIVMVTGVGWLLSFIVLHWGLWQKRGNSGVFLPWLSLGLCGLEIAILAIGGLAWSPLDLAIGLLLPGLVLVGDRFLSTMGSTMAVAVLQPDWWQQKYNQKKQSSLQNFIALQVFILILFICGTASVSWAIGKTEIAVNSAQPAELLVVLILVLSFVGVAIACWTVLPQVVAVNEGREQAEALSAELQKTLQQLQKTQLQMVQQEKMSTLGQLVAGVAHEINNPINFIHGNISHAQGYVKDLLNFIQLYQKHYPAPVTEIQTQADDLDLDFLTTDLLKILTSMQTGTDRIRQIVLSLRNFSRTDESDFKAVDIHEGIESTLMILQHRLKAKPERPAIEVIRDYGQLPFVECYLGQLNQVFMNILSNAIEALEEGNLKRNYQDLEKNPNRIIIRTLTVEQQYVQIAIADNGPGIPQALQERIFEPFFTTKAVGKGTGMGMSISYQVISQKHNGKLYFSSNPEQGTEFVIQLPIQQSSVATDN